LAREFLIYKNFISKSAKIRTQSRSSEADLLPFSISGGYLGILLNSERRKANS